MAKTKVRSATSEKASVKEVRQANVIKKLKKEDKWLKWGLLAALILILLLLLWIGYATDWMNGLRKDAAVTPLSSSLDSSKSGSDKANDSTNGGGSGSTSGSGGSGGTGGSGGGGTNGGGSTNTTTEKSTTTNNTTTNNTTTNNGGGGSGGTNPTNLYDALIAVYEDTQIGDNLSDVVDYATSLGLGANCSVALLIETCVISAGDNSITIRGVAGTGLVTSVLEDLL